METTSTTTPEEVPVQESDDTVTNGQAIESVDTETTITGTHQEEEKKSTSALKQGGQSQSQIENMSRLFRDLDPSKMSQQ
jgi:hypothetical protein